MKNVHAVVLAGGRGERFWPQSREKRPKQLLALTGGKSMLEETIARVEPLAPSANQWIVTGRGLVAAIKRLGVASAHLVGEPMGRNTAPAIALAAAEIARVDPDGVMIVLPSDHAIKDVPAFRETLRAAVGLARQDYLVTIGIPPDRPETGYGYVERGDILPSSDIPCFAVKSFREKPDRATAERFVKSGYFYWNAGIFVWRAATILRQIERLMPELARGLDDWQRRGGLAAGPKPFAEFYRGVAKVSIDYGVMEKAERVAVIRGDFGWDDLGSWEAIERFHPTDEAGNVAIGEAVAVDSSGTITVCDRGMIAALGVRDLIVVRSGDAVLVCPRSRAQDVRAVLERLRQQRRLKKYL
ncbi:MAG: sugar phosphate nucleotidyltransferase [Candidatus Edwardsbacteria bacterium]|jgi:mannose-1-phosphate guanylyltransferase|nr:sugar phosphate nucleotidyltransferase [Candidatus Edwardsbacteria bacterium]